MAIGFALPFGVILSHAVRRSGDWADPSLVRAFLHTMVTAGSAALGCVVAALMLMPDQSPLAMGLEVVIVMLLVIVGGTVLGLRGVRNTEAVHRGNAVVGLAGFELACLICLVGGVFLVAGSVAGLYWLAVGMCVGVVKAVSDAWVFLVEINR